MQTVAQALTAMLDAVTPLPSEQVTLAQALGRVLAKPVEAMRDHPPWPASQMDGYAVRSSDTPGTLMLIGESAAGHGFDGTLGAGCAIRVSTGAAVPNGADTVVIQEDVTRAGDSVIVPKVKPDQNIRTRALDFKAGTQLLQAGRRLDGIALALAAASGAATLAVARAPRIAILTGGDELTAPGDEPGPWQIYDSGIYGVGGLIRSWGGVLQRLPLEKDNQATIARAAEQGLRNSDLLVVIGGASVGDHDHARPALLQLGLTLAVEKIALRPGKPTWFGTTPLGHVLGLPGNPASALVCAHLFLAPLLRALQGAAPDNHFIRARLADALPANGGREHYLRARLSADDEGRLQVRAFENQDSSLLSVFASANALIRLAPNCAALPAGALMDVLPLGDL